MTQLLPRTPSSMAATSQLFIFTSSQEERPSSFRPKKISLAIVEPLGPGPRGLVPRHALRLVATLQFPVLKFDYYFHRNA